MTPELEYVINSGAWSIGGLVLGYALGRLERGVRRIEETIEQKESKP